MYDAMFQHFGPQFWWPGETPFEIIVGAILTQNTNWKNVEKAILNLKQAKCLTPQKLHKLPFPKLVQLIRPAGYFNVKAKRLKHFMTFLFKEYGGDLHKMEREELSVLREKLLGVNGIGPETADSILLYAFHKPVFVIDAYTKRFMHRHGLIEADEDYHTVQKRFHDIIQADAKLYNEYHAMIVRLGKDYCKTKEQCQTCPLNDTHYWPRSTKISVAKSKQR
jgi:endonuclease III related protein